MIVFDRLWKKLEEKGVSTYTLREEHGIDSRTIRRLKSNQNVTVDTLNKFCIILDCGLDEIAEFIPEEKYKI